MRYRIFVGILVLALSIVLACTGTLAFAAESAIDLIPCDATITAFMSGNRDDAGLAYLRDLWKASRHEYGQKREAINAIYTEIDTFQIASAVIISNEKTNPQYVVVVRIPRTGDGPRQFNILSEAVKVLLRYKEELQMITYLDHRIIYAPDLDPKDLSAYTEIGDNIVLGSSIDILKKVIGIYKGYSSSMAQNEKFTTMRSRLLEPCDGFVYVDNKDLKFTETLREWEKEYHMTVLMSAEALDAINFSFDVVDENVMKGKIIFMSRNEGVSFVDVEDDARFFDGIIKRKFVAEKTGYRSGIVTDGKYATLEFEADGTKPLWVKAFGKERKEMLREAEARKGELEGQVAEARKLGPEEMAKGKSYLYLPRIIFILILIGLASLAFILRRVKL